MIVFSIFVWFSWYVYGKFSNVKKIFLNYKLGTLSVDYPLPQTSDHMNQEPIHLYIYMILYILRIEIVNFQQK